MTEKKKGWMFAQKFTWIYLAVMGGIFPLFYQNGFFNILISKYAFFGIATGVYAVGMMILYLTCLKDEYCRKRLFSLSSADKWMLFFLACCLTSQIFTEYKEIAWTGSEGRYNGLLAMILYGLVYFMVSRGYCKSKILAWIFLISGGAVNLLAILNHFEIDPLNIQLILSEEQQSMFISTVGNINIFSGFASMYVSMAFALFCIAKKRSFQIGGIVGIVIGMGGLIAGNSDSGFLGIIVLCLFFLVLFHIQKRFLRKWVYGIILILASSGLMGVLQIIAGDHAIAYKGGFAEMFANEKLLIVAAILGICYPLVLKGMKFLRERHFTKKQLLAMVLSLMGLCVVVVLWMNRKEILTFLNQGDFLEFNDEWGTYRGFIWKRSFWIYLDLPFIQKIFGCGLDTIRSMMNLFYRDDMINIAGKIYDNAHNEYLQYLVTIGIAGVTAYVGLLVQSMCTAIKRSKDSLIFLVLFAGVISYAVQSTVNISQSIITFFLFLWLGLIEGERRKESLF